MHVFSFGVSEASSLALLPPVCGWPFFGMIDVLSAPVAPSLVG